MTVKGLSIGIWLAAIAVGVVANITVGEGIRSGAIEGACREYSAEESLILIGWDAPGNRPNRYPGSCTFEDPVSGDVTHAEDSEIRVGAEYQVLVVLSSVIAVSVVAVVLAVGGKVFGDD